MRESSDELPSVPSGIGPGENTSLIEVEMFFTEASS